MRKQQNWNSLTWKPQEEETLKPGRKSDCYALLHIADEPEWMNKQTNKTLYG